VKSVNKRTLTFTIIHLQCSSSPAAPGSRIRAELWGLFEVFLLVCFEHVLHSCEEDTKLCAIVCIVCV
jgi:hypothetical protein